MRRRQFLVLLRNLCLAPLLGSKLTSANEQFTQSLAELLQGQALTESAEILLTLPDSAEDGASVPLQFMANLPQVRSMRILVEKNPTPLSLAFFPQAGMRPYFSGRIKMAESCYVWLIVETHEGWWSSKRWVNVMKPGCGTG